MLSTIKGYNKLTENLQQHFERTYKSHFQSMGTTEKENHTVDCIKEIKVNREERCLEVYFNHGFYKYFMNGTWG